MGRAYQTAVGSLKVGSDAKERKGTCGGERHAPPAGGRAPSVDAFTGGLTPRRSPSLSGVA
jgi:hypothetical protein